MIINLISKSTTYEVEIYRTVYKVQVHINQSIEVDDQSIKVQCVDDYCEDIVVEGQERADVIASLISLVGKLY